MAYLRMGHGLTVAPSTYSEGKDILMGPIPEPFSESARHETAPGKCVFAHFIDDDMGEDLLGSVEERVRLESNESIITVGMRLGVGEKVPTVRKGVIGERGAAAREQKPSTCWCAFLQCMLTYSTHASKQPAYPIL